MSILCLSLSLSHSLKHSLTLFPLSGNQEMNESSRWTEEEMETAKKGNSKKRI